MFAGPKRPEAGAGGNGTPPGISRSEFTDDDDVSDIPRASVGFGLGVDKTTGFRPMSVGSHWGTGWVSVSRWK